MNSQSIESLFSQAGEIDSSVILPKKSIQHLIGLRVDPTSYSQPGLFHHIANGRIYLCKDFPKALHQGGASTNDIRTKLIKAIRTTIIDYKVRTKTGLSRGWHYYSPREVADKWQRGRSKLNITDLHIRNTSIEKTINTKVLSQFNLLPLMAEQASWIEMMTMVVSGKGGFSDSHSDDCDGSNHCFVGTKLWLAWDTAEGIAAGLQDLDQQNVSGRCAFDIDTFVSLKSARWFTVSSGQTLFMPGHYTHKVITLDPYLGVGSFYLCFPNLMRTVVRWQRQTPNWQRLEPNSVRNTIYQELFRTSITKWRTLNRTSKSNQEKWGVEYLLRDLDRWNRHSSVDDRKLLYQLPGFKRLCTMAGYE